MKTIFAKTNEIIKGGIDAPLNLAVIPNYMGINFCSVEGLSWTKQEDGQLVNLTIHFIPAKEATKRAR